MIPKQDERSSYGRNACKKHAIANKQRVVPPLTAHAGKTLTG